MNKEQALPRRMSTNKYRRSNLESLMILKLTRQFHKEQDIYYTVAKYLHTHNYREKNSFAIMLVLKANLFQAIDILGDGLSITHEFHIGLCVIVSTRHTRYSLGECRKLHPMN